MDYLLAKQLKDAGFPQNHDWKDDTRGDYCIRCMVGLTSLEHKPNDDRPCIPTLEELIEACGDNFVGVNLIGVPGYKHWKAVHINLGTHTTYGPTPTIAVAKLWLSLQAKQN